MSKYNIERFIEAQNVQGYGSYAEALKEIKAGRKETHWIWYIFPQHIKLGRSEKSKKYGITCLSEAKEYFENDILRERLIEIFTALYELDEDDPVAVFGIPDAYKMRSCCTLFRMVAPECDIFDKVLKKYCQGQPCEKTLTLLVESNMDEFAKIKVDIVCDMIVNRISNFYHDPAERKINDVEHGNNQAVEWTKKIIEEIREKVHKGEI